jgi:Na+/proline symporter
VTGELMSANAFHWVLIALTGGLAGSWLFHDALHLLKHHRADASDPQIPDKRFGYIIGILIGIIGIVGCVGYHLQFVA